MNYLVLIRHGQSIWNLEKRFTGWVDVDLTDNGKLEAEKAGSLIKKKDISIDLYYSSLQLRAKNTLKIIQKVLNDQKDFIKTWDIKPEPLSKKSSYHPLNIKTYKDVPKKNLPDSESLKDTYDRVIKFYNKEIQNKIKNKNILISAHGNSIRALCKYLFKLDNTQISKLEIPTGNPLVIEFNNDDNIKNCEYLDKDRAKDLLVF